MRRVALFLRAHPVISFPARNGKGMNERREKWSSAERPGAKDEEETRASLSLSLSLWLAFLQEASII